MGSLPWPTTSRQKPAFSSALKTMGALSVKGSMARRAPAPLKWVQAESKCAHNTTGPDAGNRRLRLLVTLYTRKNNSPRSGDAALFVASLSV